MTERLYDATQAATLLGVPRARINEWRSRGRVMPADVVRGPGRGGKGVPLYRLEELRPLADQYRLRIATRGAG